VSHALDLLFLGSGNAFAAGRYWSSFLLNGRFLFDCSPVALPHLKRSGIAIEDIEAVFITHFHADHFFGLPFLLLDYSEKTPRTKPLTIVGPPGVEQRIRTVTDAGFPRVNVKPKTYEEHFIEVQDGATIQAGDLLLTARRVDHVDDLECYGYRAEVGGRTLAYSGDTKMCEPLVGLAQGADAFVVECSCWETECGPHLDPNNIRDLRARLGPKTTFVLTHLDAGNADLGIENTIVADDLKRLAL
jgi:ribonuclease BN (tRNA processing enzyme)